MKITIVLKKKKNYLDINLRLVFFFFFFCLTESFIFVINSVNRLGRTPAISEFNRNLIYKHVLIIYVVDFTDRGSERQHNILPF